MAYAAVASVSETIDIVLKYHKESISREFEDQMKSIQDHSIFFRSFLEEFRERGNNWDETIREVADRAEEIIELLLSDLLMLETTTTGGSGSGSGSSKREVHNHYSLGDLERVSEEMESMSNRVKGKHTEAIGEAEEELMKIISQLRGGSYSREVTVIVGMEGMGKAALAKKAYDHPLIVEHFEIRAWSKQYNGYYRRRTLVELLRCMNADPDSMYSDSEKEMMERVKRMLGGRRFLIVVDDIGSSYFWSRLKRAFPYGGNGSRIILTTSNLNFACGDSAQAGYIHRMPLLDEDKAWNVIRQNVFGGDPCPSQLESVGKKIAGSCEGLPLCIQVVSTTLAAADHTVAAWEDISENMKKKNSNEDEDENVFGRVYKVLSVSYTYLPHHLKPCILYFGCFPRDQEIRVSKLIKLWVAEGFLNETESKSCEDIGEENVEDLVRRGLVSVTKTKYFNGSTGRRIKSVKTHRLVQEVCVGQAHIDNFNYDGWLSEEKLLCCRRVSSSTYLEILEGVYGSTIRTIMISSDTTTQLDYTTIRWSFGNARLLRVLDLLNAYSHHLDDQVFHLFHLRYLAFRCHFTNISQTISNLQNLQTLIIRPIDQNDAGFMFHNLADGIWRMPQLRHLFIFRFNLPARILGPMSALEDLQTLSQVVNFMCSRDNLKLIPNLKKLDLLYTTYVTHDYEFHNLIYLHKLQTLKIEMNRFFVRDYKMHFVFPPSLNKLNLCGLQLPWEDMKTVASLPNLQVLKLRRGACIGLTWETSEGGFSQLIYLLIEDSNLVYWKTETSHFPKLKHLALRRCWYLLEAPDDIGKIQTLELIELDGKNRALLISANRIHKDRQTSGDDRLQILVV